MESNENILFSNYFGSITNKRVILNNKRGSIDIPIGQITSSSFQHERNYFLSILSFIIAIVFIFTLFSNLNDLNGLLTLIILFIIIIGLLAGIANWIGHHNIILSISGKDRKPIKVEMSKTREGREFYNAIRQNILK